MKLELALCYYPTSIALIDDNESFLFNLQQLLKVKVPTFKCTTFSNPCDALKFANDLHNSIRKKGRRQSAIDNNIDAERFILDTLNQSGGLRNDNARFNEISVVVVDLDMPGINGLEFCRKIENPNIKKILLTGMAADQEVIQAFNNNEIHYYIKKSDDNMAALLEAAIRRMQHQYFLDISAGWKSEAIDNFTPLFSDPVFADYFEELCASLGVSEYYFQTNPSRYQLEFKDGAQSSLLVFTDEEIQAQLKILHEEEAPRSIISKIDSRTHLPYFPTADGYYIAELDQPEQHLYPSNLVPGDKDYYCAIVGDTGSTGGNISYVVPSVPDGFTLH